MKIKNKILTIALILAFLLVLLSNIAYAKPFTEGFEGVFIKINDFFEKEQYKAYAKTIDFIVFALLFTAIYMRGVKFAFKEVKKIEKVIAVVLGLTTAFLMVIGDFSIVALLPFVIWFLYFLLFVLIWWLLKGMKSKFWRFVLALVLTLLLLLLFQLLFSGILNGISCPEKALPWLNWLIAILIFILLMFLLKDIKNGFGRFLLALLLTVLIVLLIIGLLKASSIEAKCPEMKSAFSFFDDFTDSLKGIDIGRISPSTPQFLRDLTLQQVETPGKKKEEPSKAVEDDKPAAPPRTEPGSTIVPTKEPQLKGLEPTMPQEIPGPQSSLPTSGGLSDAESRRLAREQTATAQAGDSDVPLSQSEPGNMSKYYWVGIVLLVIILALGGREVRKRKKGKEKPTIQDILSRIEEVYKKKRELIEKLTSSQKRKETLALSHDNIRVLLKKIEEEGEREKVLGLKIGQERKGAVYWYEEQAKLKEEKEDVGGLNEIEKQWIAETREIIKLEYEFIRSLREWRITFGKVNIDIEKEHAELEQLIVRAKDSILVLLLRLYGKETQLEHIEEELIIFLEDEKHRGELIREKHRFLKDANAVTILVKEEGRIIKTVGEKVGEQNKLLAQLNFKIKETIERGISRRRFFAGGVAAGLMTGTAALTQEAPPKGLEPTITTNINE